MKLAGYEISMDVVVQLLDILIVWYLVYRALLVIRGTRAVPMIFGLSLIGFVYFLAKPLGLVTLAWLIDSFLSSIILVIVVIFQDEIRRALTKVGVQPFLFKNGRGISDKTFEDIALATSKLAKARLGSIVVVQREVGLDEFLEEGVAIDARVNRKLLYSIFVKDSPLHDGAVIIEGDRVKAAGCVLPLSFNPDLDPSLGTRHRAALGISERSDAVVVVTSEESGAISLVMDGKMHRNLDTSALRELLEQHGHGGSSGIRAKHTPDVRRSEV
jgi:diadenylate cyclase